MLACNACIFPHCTYTPLKKIWRKPSYLCIFNSRSGKTRAKNKSKIRQWTSDLTMGKKTNLQRLSLREHRKQWKNPQTAHRFDHLIARKLRLKSLKTSWLIRIWYDLWHHRQSQIIIFLRWNDRVGVRFVRFSIIFWVLFNDRILNSFSNFIFFPIVREKG